MRTKHVRLAFALLTRVRRPAELRGVASWVVLLAITVAAPAARAQVLWVANTGSASIKQVVNKYDAVTGAVISSPFFTLPFSGGHPMVADRNNHVFVVGQGLNGYVGEFDAITGAAINAQFVSVSGLNPQAIALDG